MDGKGAGPSQGPSTSGTQQQPQLVTRMQQLLATLNVEEYEPRVVNQLVDFVYRYISEVLQDAEAFNGSAAPPGAPIDMESLMLAVQARSAFIFAQPPDIDELTQMADVINSKDLPRFPAHKAGLLVPEQEHLMGQNYTINPPPGSGAGGHR